MPAADAQTRSRELARRFALVACVSGRRAIEARRVVGVDELTYAGNHGLEVLPPGEREAELDPRPRDGARSGRGIRRWPRREDARGGGLRLEDKGPIQALHWRGAATSRGRASGRGGSRIGAEAAGLEPRWGRKVLEIRPTAEVDKGTAVRRLLEGGPIERRPVRRGRSHRPRRVRALRSMLRGGSAARAPSASGSPPMRRRRAGRRRGRRAGRPRGARDGARASSRTRAGGEPRADAVRRPAPDHGALDRRRGDRAGRGDRARRRARTPSTRDADPGRRLVDARRRPRVRPRDLIARRRRRCRGRLPRREPRPRFRPRARAGSRSFGCGRSARSR